MGAACCEPSWLRRGAGAPEIGQSGFYAGPGLCAKRTPLLFTTSFEAIILGLVLALKSADSFLLLTRWGRSLRVGWFRPAGPQVP